MIKTFTDAIKSLENQLIASDEARKKENERAQMEIMSLKYEVRALKENREPVSGVAPPNFNAVVVSLNALHKQQTRIQKKVDLVYNAIVIKPEILPRWPLRSIDQIDEVKLKMKDGGFKLELVNIYSNGYLKRKLYLNYINQFISLFRIGILSP